MTTERCLRYAKSASSLHSELSYQLVLKLKLLNQQSQGSTYIVVTKFFFLCERAGPGPCERAGPGPRERAGPGPCERAGSGKRPTSWLVVFYTLVPRYNHYQLLPRQHHCRKDMSNIHLCCLGNRLFISNTSSLVDGKELHI